MSHFTVMVIGDNPEKQLAPYHEYECTGIKDEHVVFVGPSETSTELAEKYKEAKKEYNYKTKDEFMQDYYGYEKNGNKWGRWTNPNAKWDWYVLGGRWSGLIQLKPNTKGAVGEPGVFENEPGIDQAKKGDIANFDDLTTFAVIKDGKWYERGEMGWWGVVHNENENWDTKQKELIKGLPDDTLISIYDCHI